MIDVSNVGSAGRPYLAKAVRSLRIIGIEKKVSASANKYDMLLFRVEICFPETETVNGAPVKIAGLQASENIVFHGKNNMPLEELKALCGACKAPLQVDLDNPAFLKANFLGKGIRAELKTEVNVLKQTDEAGNQVPVLDDNGNPVTDNNYKIGRIIGADERFTIAAEAVPY